MPGPATLTYASLISDVLAYCERPDDALLIAQLPRCVMLAENRVATDLKVKGTTELLAATFTVGDPHLEKPAFWRDTVSFQVKGADGKRFNLYPRAYEYCRNFWPDDTKTDVPRFYADYGADNYLIVPTPNAALNFELYTHVRLSPLSADNQTNWLTVNAPQLLFYAAMTEASIFLKNDDKLATYGNLYRDTLSGLSSEDSSRRDDATTVPK